MFTFYNLTTKQVRGITDCPPEEIGLNLMDNEGWIAGSFDGRYWIDDSDIENIVVIDKIPVPHTLTGNTITLPGEALSIEITGPITDSFDIPAGETELAFTADVPGQYTLTLSGVKYLPTEVQIAV